MMVVKMLQDLEDSFINILDTERGDGACALSLLRSAMLIAQEMEEAIALTDEAYEIYIQFLEDTIELLEHETDTRYIETPEGIRGREGHGDSSVRQEGRS